MPEVTNGGLELRATSAKIGNTKKNSPLLAVVLEPSGSC